VIVKKVLQLKNFTCGYLMVRHAELVSASVSWGILLLSLLKMETQKSTDAETSSA